MADADVYEVVRTLLASALEQAASTPGNAQQALDAARNMNRPKTWADVLPWALAEVSALDPRLSVGASGDAITATFRDAGGTATVSVVAFGDPPATVVVGIDGEVDLRHGTVSISGRGRGTWTIDAAGPVAPGGDAQVTLTVVVPTARPIADLTGAQMELKGDLVVVATLSGSAPVWILDVTAPGLSASVAPGALLDMEGLPGPGIAFAPSLHAGDGKPPELQLGLR